MQSIRVLYLEASLLEASPCQEVLRHQAPRLVSLIRCVRQVRQRLSSASRLSRRRASQAPRQASKLLETLRWELLLAALAQERPLAWVDVLLGLCTCRRRRRRRRRRCWKAIQRSIHALWSCSKRTATRASVYTRRAKRKRQRKDGRKCSSSCMWLSSSRRTNVPGGCITQDEQTYRVVASPRCGA